MEKVNLAQKLASFGDHWRPKVVAELNGQHVKLVKLQGEFVWHRHEGEDEMFLVLMGRLRIDFTEGPAWIEPGEFIVVPRGVDHRPAADEEVSVLLFEPASTINTGTAEGERTVIPDRI
jgi:mannose-6-phosphate isomerase-like protein (cupin superfamily)